MNVVQPLVSSISVKAFWLQADELCLSHCTGVYFAVIRLLEGHPETVMSTLHSKFLPTLAANYMIWPLVSCSHVPVCWRSLESAVVSNGSGSAY